MNPIQQLKLLNDTVRRLFSQGINEQNAFEQVQADSRFNSIKRTSIQFLYKKFQTDVDKVANKRQLENERKRKVEEQKRQSNDEHKRMIQYRQNAKNSLICEDSDFNYLQCSKEIWQNRYFVNLKADRQNNNTHMFKFYDLLQNITKEVSVQSIKWLREIRFLSDNFIILIESGSPSSFVHLAQINLIDGCLQFIQKLEFQNISCLLLDSFDSSRFLLLFRSENGAHSAVVCKLISGKIEIIEEIGLGILSDTYEAYCNNQLLMLKHGKSNDFSDATITVQDLGADAEKSKKTLKLKPLPNNVHDYNGVHTWSAGHFFISFRFRSTGEYGIAFTEPQTCKWTLLEFATNCRINRFLLVNNCDLLIFVNDLRSKKTSNNIHKLPMRKPDFLRYKAWFKLVMLFKKRKAADPYEEARKYLPLNLDVCGQFVANQGDK